MAQEAVPNIEGTRLRAEAIKSEILVLLSLRLYVNDYTPTATSVATDFTEASYNGYAAQAVGDWGNPTKISDDEYQIALPQKTFTVSSDGGTDEVYGYYFTDASDNVYSAGRDVNAPTRMNIEGDEFPIEITEVILRVCP